MNCICCDASTRSLTIKDEFFGNALQWCDQCNHIQLKKKPSEEELINYYETSYSKKRKVMVGEAYFQIMKKRARAQKKFVEAHLTVPENSEVHDIGCGYGFLIEQFQKGNITKGFDYDPDAVSFCKDKNLDVELQRSGIPSKSEKKCFMALLSHVFEHFVDPEFELRRLLKKYEYIFMEIPSYGVINLPSLEDKEGHINFFCRSSLQSFLAKIQCEAIAIESYGPSKQFFLNQEFHYLRKFRHLFQKDYFFDQYEKRHEFDQGIWLRCIIKG
jgi:SAM-dependent methyltransferase